jgi:pimeloyl-ACP methyl ester carboxylesterase
VKIKMNYKYPIVKVKTKDGITLHGLLVEPENPTKLIKIHLHGTSGSFFYNDFYEPLIESALKLDIAHLNTNNRGAGVYELEKGSVPTGASLEKFEDCVFDIDAWIEFAKSRGYEKIILEGHSFGTEKIVYYMNKGSYKDKVDAVILLGFSDNVGTQQKYEKRIGSNYFKEAQKLVEEGKGEYLLSDIYALAGEMPISAQTYLNFTKADSANSKALPLRHGKNLEYFKNIKVPILAVVGDDEDSEYTIIPIKEAMKLLESENKLTEVHQIKDCNHCFEGKEKEMVNIVEKFLKRRVL